MNEASFGIGTACSTRRLAWGLFPIVHERKKRFPHEQKNGTTPVPMLREGNSRVLISEQFIEERDQGDPFTELGRKLFFCRDWNSTTAVPLSDYKSSATHP